MEEMSDGAFSDVLSAGAAATTAGESAVPNPAWPLPAESSEDAVSEEVLLKYQNPPPEAPAARSNISTTRVALPPVCVSLSDAASDSAGFDVDLPAGAVKIGTKHWGLAHLTSRPAACRGTKPGVSHIGQLTRHGLF